MERKLFREIKHLLPADCWAAKLNRDFEEEIVMYHQGDLEVTNLNLDTPREAGEYIFLILVDGNMQARNIYNEETDGATSLIVLGNLSADNIVVGGQEIYVSGQLHVKDLYWGDYNHGNLAAQGTVQMRVFLSTDYSFDYKRFIAGDNVEIQHLFWDDSGYEDGEPLTSLFSAHFLDEPKDEIYSWSYWLNRTAILEGLERNEPLLLANFPEEEKIPSFFADEQISDSNLLRFADSTVLTGYTGEAGENVILQYWDGDVFRRVFMQLGKPLSVMTYLQHGEQFACMIYFTQHQETYRIARAYKPVNSETWMDLDNRAPVICHQFLQENWRILLQHYSEMVYYREQFTTHITREKLEELLSLPLVKDKHYDYYNEDHVIEHGSFQWSFRLPGSNKSPRITIVRILPDDQYDFYHFDLKEWKDGRIAPLLYTQADDGYEAVVKEVATTERDKYRKALSYFNKMEKVLRKMNEEHGVNQ